MAHYTICLQGVCQLLQQGLNATVIVVGHSSDALASSRNVLCSVTDILSKPAQAQESPRTAVACCLEYSSGTCDLFGCAGSAGVFAAAATSSPSKQQRASGHPTLAQVQSAGQIRKSLKLGCNSICSSSAELGRWLVGDVLTSHHCEPCKTDVLQAVVSQLWYSPNTNSSSCLTIFDLSSCYRAAECVSSRPKQQPEGASNNKSSSTSKHSPGAQRPQGSPKQPAARGERTVCSKPGSAALWSQLSAYIHRAANHIRSKAGMHGRVQHCLSIITPNGRCPTPVQLWHFHPGAA
jgi:hypothetical protein